MARPKQEIITFKVDASLAEALRSVENRSAFIRGAILAALDSTCPLCQGSGVLSPEQKKHWTRFAEHHELEECASCHELHIVCEHEEKER